MTKKVEHARDVRRIKDNAQNDSLINDVEVN